MKKLSKEQKRLAAICVSDVVRALAALRERVREEHLEAKKVGLVK